MCVCVYIYIYVCVCGGGVTIGAEVSLVMLHFKLALKVLMAMGVPPAGTY